MSSRIIHSTQSVVEDKDEMGDESEIKRNMNGDKKGEIGTGKKSGGGAPMV